MPAMLARAISDRETRAPTRSSISRASLSRKTESSRDRIRLTLLIPLVSTRVYFHTLTNLVASTKATWPGDQGSGTLRGKCVHGGAQRSRFDVEFAFLNR